MRHWLRGIHRWHATRLVAATTASLSRSAIVFAPHQDDETLGCGGTILRKKQSGAAVKIAFLTDGSAFNNHLMPPDEMARLRQKEALAAARELGLEKSDVLFLGVKDGALGHHRDQALALVKALLRQYRPEEVYVPYRLDPHSDHVATHTVVSDALKAHDPSLVMWEYPVWFWNVWPWVRWPERTGLRTSALKHVLRSNKRLFADFTHAVDIRTVAGQKQAALSRYQSQVTRYLHDTDWPTLGDVSNGEFLDCFFQAQEIFCCRTAAELT